MSLEKSVCCIEDTLHLQKTKTLLLPAREGKEVSGVCSWGDCSDHDWYPFGLAGE